MAKAAQAAVVCVGLVVMLVVLVLLINQLKPCGCEDKEEVSAA